MLAVLILSFLTLWASPSLPVTRPGRSEEESKRLSATSYEEPIVDSGRQSGAPKAMFRRVCEKFIFPRVHFRRMTI